MASGPTGWVRAYENGFAWNKQYGEPRRSGPAASLPLASVMEVSDVIWQRLPARVVPKHVVPVTQRACMFEPLGRELTHGAKWNSSHRCV